jgi:glucokinase
VTTTARDGYVVAVDLGGTITKFAAAHADGSLSQVERRSTYLDRGGAGLLTWLADQIVEFTGHRSEQPCLGYGVVVPGIIDVTEGRVKAAPNVDWYDVSLREHLTQRTGLSGVVGHDVRSGGLAEWRLGSGVGTSNLLFLPLGTGIAGAMVVDGRLLDADGYAGEIGHIRVAAAGDTVCACGQVGCLETVASAAGVVRSYRRLAGSQATADQGAPTAEAVAASARAGDRAALDAFTLATEALTEALTLYVTLLAPEKIVVGGGLAGSADLFLPQLTTAIHRRLKFQRTPALVAAALGADAGLMGAGLAGWDHLRAVPDRPVGAHRDTAAATGWSGNV